MTGSFDLCEDHAQSLLKRPVQMVRRDTLALCRHEHLALLATGAETQRRLIVYEH
ncbi:hypothetical protein [Streptomyces sp. NBC_00893]|uniref:hypothetical protein n=1 Tax=Streptomyces sp. NBC_00893 TaxID=2975862 RepID=UPI002251DAEA|nr:hypothetical protein [Streptomyces sp. NBC_00893]MCX4844612.1 hypothetical protein [Streptomyces sp. NBC_00893]